MIDPLALRVVVVVVVVVVSTSKGQAVACFYQ